MHPSEILRRVAADRRSGATALAVRTAAALDKIDDPAAIRIAARRILRVHPAMAPLWRVFALAAGGGDGAVREFARTITAETELVAAAAAGWAIPRRADVLTHSASGTVRATLRAAQARVRAVVCTASLPGGEGRTFAARLRRDGFDAGVIPDAAVGRAAAAASVAVVGADAVTEQAVINKVGTLPFALAAREHGIACYVLAGQSKMIPHEMWDPDRAPDYEATPLELFDAVITERGPRRPGAIRKTVASLTLPRWLRSAAG